MISKLNFFRPDRSFVKDLKEKYTCLVKDEFTTADSLITVPLYLTVFQHHIPKICRKSVKEKNHESSCQFREKICFYLVGSKQAPLLTEFSSNTQNVDRIEFKGHIGFEHPIFNVLNQLPKLRKVTFLLNPCKQRDFIGDSSTEKVLGAGQLNLLVTNLKIAFENQNHGSIEKKVTDTDTDDEYEDSDKNKLLKAMITRLLSRMVQQCPNIKRLSMDVPNFAGVREVIENALKKLTRLKPTKLVCVNGNLLVGKDVNDMAQIPTLCAEMESTNKTDDDAPETIPNENDNDKQLEGNKPNGNTDDEPETTPCRLFGMSKLLGSMLGIPTSSLPQSSNTSNTPTDDNPDKPQNLNDAQSFISEISISSTVTVSDPCSLNPNQPITAVSSSSSASEIITYAAAAASAAVTHATSTSTSNNIHRHLHRHHRVGGNDNGHFHHIHHHHRYHHHHISNEGSREVATATAAEEEESNAKSSIRKKPCAAAADLGKPVFVSSTRKV